MIEVKEDYSLKAYNTFDIDVKCKYFVESDEEEALRAFVADYEWEPSEVLILGGGSNFLFTEDFAGTVFYPAMQGKEKIKENEEEVWVRIGAGVEWVQNVGAYGMEAGERIDRVEAIALDKATRVEIAGKDCRFAYRDSIFKREWKNQYIITRVVFRLSKKPEFRLDYGTLRSELEKMGGEVNLTNIRQAVIRIRRSKLPDVAEIPNAGSFFKNPMVRREQADRLLAEYPGMPVYEVDDACCKLAAGWLIEQCGWKGRTLGKAGVHDKQALVLVNQGGASGIEIARLANEVRKSVFMKFGIWIEPEVYVI